MIWTPLTKVSVVETSASSTIKAGATGFVVLLSEEAMGYRNYWGIDLILTRNGKKGQRKLQYRRAKTKKLIIKDVLSPELMELMTTNILAVETIEEDVHRGLDLLTLKQEPYSSKDILNWNVWDFLGWLAAASQLCSFLSTGDALLDRMHRGMSLTSRPTTQSIFLETGNMSANLLDINAEFIIGVLLIMPTTKAGLAQFLPVFDDIPTRKALIEKCVKTITCGHKTYNNMIDVLENLEVEWRVYLKELAKELANPNRDKKKVWDAANKYYTWSKKAPIEQVAPTPVIMGEEENVPVIHVDSIRPAGQPIQTATISTASGASNTTEIGGHSADEFFIDDEWIPYTPPNTGGSSANNR